MQRSFYRLHSCGFTLLELTFVMMVIAIISVIVIPSWTATSLSLEMEAKRVLNDIRYVQMLSMNSGQRYRWVRVSASVYQIVNESGTAMIMPSGATQVTMTSGVTIGTLTNLPNNLIAFDSQGIPYTTSTYPGTALAATASIPLTAGGVTRTIQITAQTGYGVIV